MSDHAAARESRLTMPAWLDLILRLIVGGTFVYASLDKIADPAGFAQAIFNYRMLPTALLHPFALALPWIELVCGVAVIAGVWRRGAAGAISLMNLMFIGAIAFALMRGLDISCGCFHTQGGHAVGMSLLLRDLGLLAASLALTFLPVRTGRIF